MQCSTIQIPQNVKATFQVTFRRILHFRRHNTDCSRARVRTWQQDAPPISRDMIGGTVAFCFDMTPTSKTVTPQYVEGQVEDVSDGKSRYLPKGGKTDKGGREYGPRWVYVVFDQDGYDDSDMRLHLRGGSFYNPKKPKPGAWKLSA